MAVIKGNSNGNRLNGTNYADEIYGYLGNDVLGGGAGADDLYGGGGADRLYGGDGTDLLKGDDGNDQVFGGSGNDTLFGGNGNDRLTGGVGTDYLSGGFGADTFVYTSLADDSTPNGFGFDRIYDFNRSQGDKIDVSAFDGNRNAAGNQALRWVGEGNYTGGGIGSVSVNYDDGNAYILVDANGDRQIDFGIVVYDETRIYASDFIL